MSFNHADADKDSELSENDVSSPLVNESRQLSPNPSAPIIEEVEPMSTPRDDGIQVEPDALPIPVVMNERPPDDD